MNAHAKPPGFVIRGWHVLAGFVLFFAVVIAVDVAFMVAAYRTFPGQTAKNPYEAGLAYNAQLAEHRRQAALGWRATASVDADGRLRVRVADRDGRPLDGATVSAVLLRPATSSGEVTLKIHDAGSGEHVADTRRLGGAWNMDGVVARGSDRLDIQRRLTWP